MTKSWAIVACMCASFGMTKNSAALELIGEGTFTDVATGQHEAWSGQFDVTGTRLTGAIETAGLAAGKVPVEGAFDIASQRVSIGLRKTPGSSGLTGFLTGQINGAEVAGDYTLGAGQQRGAWNGRFYPAPGSPAPEMGPEHFASTGDEPPPFEQGAYDPTDPATLCSLLEDKGAMHVMSGGGQRTLSAYCSGSPSPLSLSSRVGAVVANVFWSLPFPKGLLSMFSSAMATGKNNRVNNPAGDVYPLITQNEVSVAVSGATWENIVVAFNDSSHIGLIGYANSTNHGQTWIDQGAPPPPAAPGGNNGSDPIVVSDPAGYFYLARIATDWVYGQYIGVSRSTDTTGSTFVAPVNASGSLGAPDKPNMAADPSNGNIYLCWTRFLGNATQIAFSRSTNGGNTYSSPRGLTLADSTVDSRAAVQGCSIAV